MTSHRSKSVELAPFRSMSEFFLDGSKYLAPSFNDLRSFNNRICSNLLYFQTNYFAVSLATFLLFLTFSFHRMVGGSFAIASGVLVVLLALDKIPQASALKAQYPVAVFGLGFIDLLISYMFFRAIMLFLLSIMLPILFWLLHASVRSRGVANKVKNKMEQMGVPVYDNTPMCLILTTLGFDVKDYSE